MAGLFANGQYHTSYSYNPFTNPYRIIPIGLLVEKTRNSFKRYDMAIEIFKTVALPVSIGVRGLILDIVRCVFFLGLLHPKHKTLDFAHD